MRKTKKVIRTKHLRVAGFEATGYRDIASAASGITWVVDKHGAFFETPAEELQGFARRRHGRTRRFEGCGLAPYQRNIGAAPLAGFARAVLAGAGFEA